MVGVVSSAWVVGVTTAAVMRSVAAARYPVLVADPLVRSSPDVPARLVAPATRLVSRSVPDPTGAPTVAA